MQVDKELSRRAALEVGAEAQQCYANAWRALRDLPELAGALYVEGYAVDRMHDVHASLGVIEHGWIELDGRIVDPTLHDDREPLAYYPGLRFTLGELHTAMHTIPKTTNEDLPIFYRLGWGGQDSPDMPSRFTSSKLIDRKLTHFTTANTLHAQRTVMIRKIIEVRRNEFGASPLQNLLLGIRVSSVIKPANPPVPKISLIGPIPHPIRTHLLRAVGEPLLNGHMVVTQESTEIPDAIRR